MEKHALTTIDSSLLGDRLAEARRVRRVTQQQAADAIGVARTTIVAMEKGDRRPRASDLVILASLYGLPIAELVRLEPKKARPDFVLHFRSASGHASNADRDADIKQFERLCRWYVELEEALGAPLSQRYPSVYEILNTPIERAAEEVALSERNRLGLGDGPIGDLWGILESDVGLRVFALPFRDRKVAGIFLFVEEYGGCIAVNKNHPEERRRWSAAHEYGHFLVHRYRPEVAVLTTSKRLPSEERFADAFARSFLMPASGLQRRFDSIQRSKNAPITPADVLALNHHYSVSFQAMVWRLEELRLLPAGTWDLLEEKGFKPNKARELLDLPALQSGHSDLPQRYVALAIQAFENEMLTEGQLAERLCTDRVGAREVAKRWTTQSEPLESGEWKQITLDLAMPLVKLA